MGEQQKHRVTIHDISMVYSDGTNNTDWVIQKYGTCTLLRWFELLDEIKPTKLMRFELLKSLEEQGLL